MKKIKTITNLEKLDLIFFDKYVQVQNAKKHNSKLSPGH